MTKFKKEHLLAYYNHVLDTEEKRLNELYTRRVKQSSHKRTWFGRLLKFNELELEQLTWEIAYLECKKTNIQDMHNKLNYHASDDIIYWSFTKEEESNFYSFCSSNNFTI